MPGQGQLQFDTSTVNRPDYWKYRTKIDKDANFRKYWDILYPNDYSYPGKIIAGIGAGTGAGVVASMVQFHQLFRKNKKWDPFELTSRKLKPFIVNSTRVFASVGLPFVAAGAVYGATVSLMTNIGKRERPLTHSVAAALSVGVIANLYPHPYLDAPTKQIFPATRRGNVAAVGGAIAWFLFGLFKYHKMRIGEDNKMALTQQNEMRHHWTNRWVEPRSSWYGLAEREDGTVAQGDYFDGTVTNKYMYGNKN